MRRVGYRTTTRWSRSSGGCREAAPVSATARHASGRRRALALAFDVACVLLFVALGRRSHHEGSGVGAVLDVAAPFAIGLALGWVLSPNVHRAPRSLRAG